MFGSGDAYRGNTTPEQRLWWAEEKLERAKALLREAQEKYDAALSEKEAFERRASLQAQYYQTQDW